MINKGTSLIRLSLNLKKSIPLWMKEFKIPGLSFALFNGEKIILNLEFGVKNSISQEPIISSTVFEAASLSKPVIALAALKMCREGMLDLDIPLKSYVSSSYKGDPLYLSSVTLRHILCHSSGFPSANLKIGEPLNINLPPGSQFAYSGESYCYLGFVLEHLIGNSLNIYLEENIFQPFEMRDSGFIWKEQYETQAAIGHDSKGTPTAKWKPKRLVASCSLHTTATDFARFIINTQHFPEMLDANIKVNDKISWGLGWGLEQTPDGEAFWHSGDNGSFKALALAFRQQKFGFVVMTNSANGSNIFENLIKHSIGGTHPLLDYENFDNNEHINDLDENLLSNWWEIYGM